MERSRDACKPPVSWFVARPKRSPTFERYVISDYDLHPNRLQHDRLAEYVVNSNLHVEDRNIGSTPSERHRKRASPPPSSASSASRVEGNSKFASGAPCHTAMPRAAKRVEAQLKFLRHPQRGDELEASSSVGQIAYRAVDNRGGPIEYQLASFEHARPSRVTSLHGDLPVDTRRRTKRRSKFF